MERPSLAEVHLLHTDYTLHSTLSLSGATKISRYLIRAKWDREEEGAVRTLSRVLPCYQGWVLVLATLSPQTRYI